MTGFEEVVSQQQRKVYSFAHYYLGSPQEAEDVTQETFVRAYGALGRFDGRSEPFTWMYRIAINTAKNYLVSAGRRATESAVDAQDAEQYETVIGSGYRYLDADASAAGLRVN